VPGSVGRSVGRVASTLEEQRVLQEGLYRYIHLLRYLVGVGKNAAAVCLSVVICRSTVDRLPSGLSVFLLLSRSSTGLPLKIHDLVFCQTITFFGAFTVSSRQYFSPRGTTRHPLNGFSRNLILSIFRKIVKKIQVSLKSYKNNGYFT
jgi:hypothetical protein